MKRVLRLATDNGRGNVLSLPLGFLICFVLLGIAIGAVNGDALAQISPIPTPTRTPLPSTPTNTPLYTPTDTPPPYTPTNTALPPTNTPPPYTPTSTDVPPTNTPPPPTPTNTPIPNRPPTIDLITGPTAPVNIDDQPVNVVVDFSDPDFGDTHTVTWVWGEDSTSTVQPGATSPAAQSHTYLAAGVYTVDLIVEDAAGAFDTGSYEFIIIYDPDGGFVTGGGWINSQSGAYEPDPTLVGKASFGFVSKYRKGAHTPTGNTEFQFQVADLNFQSQSYQWLVINRADHNAQYKGEGTINGALAPNGQAYKFQLWAGDDSPDVFRIKIWYEDSGDVIVYDNGFRQPIDGGSIVIHTGR